MQVSLPSGAGKPFPCSELISMSGAERSAVEDDEFDRVCSPAFECIPEHRNVAGRGGRAEKENSKEMAGHKELGRERGSEGVRE